MVRSVKTWIGKTDDAAVPPRVRLRIFERCAGRCHITGREIRPGDFWDLDHVVELILGGRHSEDNLAPALREPHQAKTATAMAVKSKIASARKKHLGIKPEIAPAAQIVGKPLPTTAKAAKRAAQGHREPVKRTRDIFGAPL